VEERTIQLTDGGQVTTKIPMDVEDLRYRVAGSRSLGEPLQCRIHVWKRLAAVLDVLVQEAFEIECVRDQGAVLQVEGDALRFIHIAHGLVEKAFVVEHFGAIGQEVVAFFGVFDRVHPKQCGVDGSHCTIAVEPVHLFHRAFDEGMYRAVGEGREPFHAMRWNSARSTKPHQQGGYARKEMARFKDPHRRESEDGGMDG
jgi:hypothetical protein